MTCSLRQSLVFHSSPKEIYLKCCLLFLLLTLAAWVDSVYMNMPNLRCWVSELRLYHPFQFTQSLDTTFSCYLCQHLRQMLFESGNFPTFPSACVAVGLPGGSVGFRGPKNQQLFNGFSPWKWKRWRLTLLSLSLYRDSSWEQNYCQTAPMQKRRKGKKETWPPVTQRRRRSMRFFFSQLWYKNLTCLHSLCAHVCPFFLSTAFWNVLQMNYCKEMHINIYEYSI